MGLVRDSIHLVLDWVVAALGRHVLRHRGCLVGLRLMMAMEVDDAVSRRMVMRLGVGMISQRVWSGNCRTNWRVRLNANTIQAHQPTTYVTCITNYTRTLV